MGSSSPSDRSLSARAPRPTSPASREVEAGPVHRAVRRISTVGRGARVPACAVCAMRPSVCGSRALSGPFIKHVRVHSSLSTPPPPSLPLSLPFPRFLARHPAPPLLSFLPDLLSFGSLPSHTHYYCYCYYECIYVVLAHKVPPRAPPSVPLRVLDGAERRRVPAPAGPTARRGTWNLSPAGTRSRPRRRVSPLTRGPRPVNCRPAPAAGPPRAVGSWCWALQLPSLPSLVVSPRAAALNAASVSTALQPC